MKRTILASLAGLLVAGCVVAPAPAPGPGAVRQPQPVVGRMTVSDLRAVAARVEPVAESTCRQRTRGLNCDFRIVVDPNANAPANAYQTLDKTGRPIIGFTQALVKRALNRDELAFVLGHEAAHHIEGHIPQVQQRAVEGAILGTIIGTLAGFDQQGVEMAQQIGGGVGARRFAKSFELEADRLGTVITARSGYNPVNGAEFFNRIPDPGDRFLGTHPPNADRLATVRRTAAGL
ncbi:MAG: M48 family metalloprotease [Alphaproteobacteria bacterium]|nr:M48 family metalloprotease [Alphaproteobacteria bacterium]NNF23702.1 M48 family metalloprotease [Paracoccaceae bacterium]